MDHNTTANQQKQGLIEMSLAMLICGTIGITVLWSQQTEVSLIFYRCLFGSIILGIICVLKGLFRQTQFTKQFWLASIIGGLALLANWYFLFSAYQKTSIGIATTVYNIQPFIMVFLCAFLFKEKITKRIIFCLGISFFGLYLITANKIASVPTQSYNLGIIQALSAATLYAIASICAKYLKGYSPIIIAFFQLLLGVVIFLPMADLSILTQMSWSTPVIATMTLGIIHTGVMYVFLYGAIQKLVAYKVASLAFLYPVLALAIDYLFLDIQLSWLHICGICLIFLGVIGVNLYDVIKNVLDRHLHKES